MVVEMQEPEAGGRDKVPVTVGKKEGLRLTLDLHSNQASFGTVNEDYNAFRVYLGGPSEFPVLQERSLSLEPGQEHSLELTAKAGTPALLAPGSCAPGSWPRSWLTACPQVISSSPGIRGLDPRDRRCYFSDEGSLSLYSTYTYTNCRHCIHPAPCAKKYTLSRFSHKTWISYSVWI